MKRTLVLLFALIPALLLAQTTPKKNKYPSLLWEISGNGLTKPSYLFGTMHVSSKIAFHLADSFYVGIRQADVVALETNPESWQEDMTQYETGQQEAAFNRRFGGYRSVPNDYLSINTLKFYKYDKKIERSLYSSPSAINNLLYRSYGNETSDFEEDTYLDMYIYQCGKKWGKQVAGVEKYGESMKLMQEAYRDAMRDKNKKNRNYEVDEEYSAGRLQEAYRKGNLDLLDSINKLNSFSDAFDEKFLYRRNEIQAASIDSILKTRSTLFVGVGAAHLPGSRGVIEILRQMGYRLRPILMNERDSRHKEEVEKLRVPVSFREETASDGLFTVSIPGKFYVFGEDGALEQQQYADMANGSYYMVTRVMTNAWMWGHDQQDVMKKIDSLLYENIPGKILSKTSINRNGYAGFDILNKTRRGDLQRYNIFVTPFEVIFFKMSGTGDYVKNGDEANKFFSSIRFRDYRSKTGTGAPVWKKFSPSYGGFSIEMPHQPYTGNDGSWIYDAEDRETGQHYRVIRSDIHNYHFAEEDSFDLGLMEESFAASEFIDKQLSRKKSHFKGYPALDCKYRDKNGSTYLARFIIQGPHYYTLVAHGKKETARMQEFLNSFEIKPFVYPQAKAYTDSSLYFSVISPVVPDSKKQRLDIPRFNFLRSSEEDEEKAEDDLLEEGTYRNKIIGNDSTGEKILVSFYKYPRYYYRADSTDSNLDEDISVLGDSSWIVKSKKSYQLPGSMKVHEVLVTDTGSSRAIWSKKFYKDGARFSLLTELDTLTAPSAFLRSFFESFAPADTLKAVNLYSKKSGLFFSDFMSKDSIAHKRAVKSIDLIELDSTDLPALKKAIGSLGFEEKNYLDIKKELIGKLDELTARESSNYLKELYYASGDTIELQYAVLETLLQQQTSYAFSIFGEIMRTEPPVMETAAAAGWSYSSLLGGAGRYGNDYDNGGFLDELNDSLLLTRAILPDLLPLLNLDDYKRYMMRLLGRMVDSNLVKPADYESYFSKFYIEARQELKKQMITEKKKAIERAEENKTQVKNTSTRRDDEKDNGNEKLGLYATLLLPYWDQPTVKTLFRQMLQSSDKKLKYSTLLLLVRDNKSYPDSLLKYFASLDDYRYQLYKDLHRAGKAGKFPAAFNNHLDLGKSSLLQRKSYGKPDTLVYIERRAATVQGKKGFIYFFKYKNKKDDMTWKLATVGLLPAQPGQFEFEEEEIERAASEYYAYRGLYLNRDYDFTNLGSTRIREEEPLASQINKELKKLLYSKRKSAREFYGDNEEEDRFDMISTNIEIRD